MALPSKLTSYVAAQRPILAAVDDSGITKALLDSHRAAVTIPSGNTDALLDSLDRLRTDPQLVVDLVAGARKMGAAEFSNEQANAHVREFVRELASIEKMPG